MYAQFNSMGLRHLMEGSKSRAELARHGAEFSTYFADMQVYKHPEIPGVLFYFDGRGNKVKHHITLPL